MHTKMKWWLVGVGLLALLAGHRLLFWEPSCNGHRLSEWVALYGGYTYTDDHWATAREAEDAIRQIGRPAIPFLVRWVSTEPREPVREICNDLTGWFARWIPSHSTLAVLRRRFTDGPVHRCYGAIAAFGVLGTNADSAVPALASVAHLPVDNPWENHDPYWGLEHNALPNRRAAFALANIGPAALPILLDLATNGSANLRCDVLYLLSQMGTNALPALPLLLQSLNEYTNRAGWIAARTLGMLRLEPGVVIPALTNALERRKDLLLQFPASEPRLYLQYRVLNSIAAYGSDARAALPAILEWLESEDPYIPRVAAQALGKMTLDAEIVVPALTKALKSRDSHLVAEAAKSLGAFGSASASAIPALMELIQRTNTLFYPSKHQANQALAQITNALVLNETRR
ncbi:MAG: HEAT repeat domain-containing protein [Verrucomicrobiota bacterium]